MQLDENLTIWKATCFKNVSWIVKADEQIRAFLAQQFSSKNGWALESLNLKNFE